MDTVFFFLRGGWPVLLLALVLSPETVFAQAPVEPACRHDDRECAAKALQGHVVTKLEFWKDALAKPVERRIAAAPPELVEYLTLDNIQKGFPNKPRSASVPEDFLREVHAAFAEIPLNVRKRLFSKLAGVYFVEDLGGTGYTDQIFNAHSSPVAGFVVLDLSALSKQTANTWATWKENTPFRAQPGFKLTAEIERKRDNNRKNAIQYILLHELGHVLAINERFHPSWGIAPKEASSADYPFFQLSWTVSREDNRYVTIFDGAFAQRKDVVYYFGAKLPAGQMVATYENLERTNFVTLYAATHPADDFAEAFASYVHTVLMKKPFAIRLYRDGKLAKTYKSCWTQKRCAEKRGILENFLQGRGG